MDASERRKRASEEAADWFVQLQADDLPRSNREQYIDWLRESSMHVAEMLRVAQVHGALEQFEHWSRIATDGSKENSKIIPLPLAEKAPVPSSVEGRGRKGIWVSTLAATIVAVLVSTTILLPKLRGRIIDTERGERRELVLNDGSVVQVDPQTHLLIKFEKKTRRVYLERGRALFHVAKSPSRPFLVYANETVVRAVGTAFGVERQRQGIVVTVSEGEVAVLPPDVHPPSEESRAFESPALEKRKEQDHSRERKRISSSAEESAPIFLSAGQQLTVKNSGSAAPVREVDSSRELAWAEGRLIFENERVTQVVEEFNRYNRVQLHVTDRALAGRPVSGVFSASDPESFIAFIQTVTPVRILRSGEQDITISTSQPQ